MKKLKEKLKNHFNKSLFIFMVISVFYSCKDNSVNQKYEKNESLAKQDFLKYANLKDTIFPNGNYIKYIPNGESYYSIEIQMSKVTDTIDFYLCHKTPGGTIPKLLVIDDFICFLQGSSSYRYLTLCTFNNIGKKIDICEFETARDVQSGRDGYIFIQGNILYFYDRNKEILLHTKLNESFILKNAILYIGDSVLIENEQGDMLTYNLKNFH